jgi:hypothetical protein
MSTLYTALRLVVLASLFGFVEHSIGPDHVGFCLIPKIPALAPVTTKVITFLGKEGMFGYVVV